MGGGFSQKERKRGRKRDQDQLMRLRGFFFLFESGATIDSRSRRDQKLPFGGLIVFISSSFFFFSFSRLRWNWGRGFDVLIYQGTRQAIYIPPIKHPRPVRKYTTTGWTGPCVWAWAGMKGVCLLPRCVMRVVVWYWCGGSCLSLSFSLLYTVFFIIPWLVTACDG